MEGRMKTLLFIFVLFFIFAISTASAADRNTLVIGLAADAASLDPHDINETVSYNVSMNIFDTLLSLSQDLGSVVNRRPGIMLSIPSPVYHSYASNPL